MGYSIVVISMLLLRLSSCIGSMTVSPNVNNTSDFWTEIMAEEHNK